MPSNVRSRLSGRVRCNVELEAHVPGARLRSAEATAVQPSSDAVIEALSGQISDITYKIPFEDLVRYPALVYISSDTATQDHFDGVTNLDVAVHYNASNPVPMPPPASPVRLPAPEQFVFPFRRSGSLCSGGLFLARDEISRGEFHLEATSDNTRCVLRTPPMRGGALATNYVGFIQKLVTTVSAGSINASIDDRYAKSPFVLKDLDIDLYDDEIRVRGTASIGLGVNAVLFSVGHFDIRLRLTLQSFHNLAFTALEYSKLFDVAVTSTSIDAYPGTDIDDLPAWVWAAIAPFAPSLSGWAALVAAFEALAKPVARDIAEAQVTSLLGAQVMKAKNAAQQDFLANYPSLTPDRYATLLSKIWYETDAVTVTSKNVRVESFIGMWGDADDVAALT